MSTSTLGLGSPPRRPSGGAQFANWLGTVALTLPFLAYGLSVVMLTIGLCSGPPLLLLLCLIVALLTIVAGIGCRVRIRRNPELSGEDAARRAYRKGFGALALSFVLIAMAALGELRCGDRVPANDSSAVGSLRTVNTACVTYASTYPERGFPSSLEQLAPPGAEEAVGASHAELIDSILAGGRKTGFVFHYTPGPPDQKEVITTYTVLARPQEFGKTSSRNFYTDHTGVIRSTRENRAATAQDSPLE